MADFSKQYCDLYDQDMPWDFDIEVIGNDLDPGYSRSIICEGLGFTAIARDLDGSVILYFPDWEEFGIKDKSHWIEYKSFIEDQKNKPRW